ncbi:NADPH-dependent FMN reductase [Halobacteriaceae archaeon GCM10025711]
MHDSPTVVALCGSRRDGSHTRTALRHALDAAADAGASTELVDLDALDLPPFHPDEETPPAAESLLETVEAADAVLLGTPVYHGSYSSTLKTALDYCGFDEFEDTTVGLLAVAGGTAFASALDHLRVVARSVHAWVLPTQVGVPNVSDAVEDGAIVDDDVARRVATLGEETVRYARIEPRPVEAGASADD